MIDSPLDRMQIRDYAAQTKVSRVPRLMLSLARLGRAGTPAQ
jgi:hypothetical protein